MKKYNAAQMLLINIGGTAQLVGGYMDHYYADQQTEAKPKKSRDKILNSASRCLSAYFATLNRKVSK